MPRAIGNQFLTFGHHPKSRELTGPVIRELREFLDALPDTPSASNTKPQIRILDAQPTRRTITQTAIDLCWRGLARVKQAVSHTRSR